MADLNVNSVTIEDLLTKLRAREWLIPEFQREFVWTIQDVIEFANSILSARPIGMATLWEQADATQLSLEPISLPDADSNGHETRTEFCAANENPKRLYAVLDGKQRCTAVAMVFGGLRSRDKRRRVSGRFFLNVAERESKKQVQFIREKDIERNEYDRDAKCISSGLFPLSLSDESNGMFNGWMRYVQEVRNLSNYPDNKLPDEEELERRDRVLKRAAEGIFKTKLAVYTVPETYDLADVCEIFETLNVSGVKVSTTDLVHSWLYADTASESKQIRLRDWISDFGQMDGAIGWASKTERPELMVQMSTACYVALEEKDSPRSVRGALAKSSDDLSTIKAADLLRTPTQHWMNFISNDTLLADYLRDFQKLVAGGYFPMRACPYPASALIYVALRFHHHFDASETRSWSREDLDAIFRGFFWRNALTNRYDQGLVTQFGVDLKELKKGLKQRPEHDSMSQWAAGMNGLLNGLIDRPLPSLEQLTDWLTDEQSAGALWSAMTLPMVAMAKRDLVNPEQTLTFPAYQNLHMHHIYPRQWCQDNKVGKLAVLLDKEKARRDWVESVANRMPLSRESNNRWKTKQPGQVLVERQITYDNSKDTLQTAFIDGQCFEYLKAGSEFAEQFWTRRADLIAKDLLKRMEIAV